MRRALDDGQPPRPPELGGLQLGAQVTFHGSCSGSGSELGAAGHMSCMHTHGVGYGQFVSYGDAALPGASG